MNRPISLERWVQYIETIRKYRPDICIDTEIIAGLPTERKEDIEQTLNLIKHFLMLFLCDKYVLLLQ